MSYGVGQNMFTPRDISDPNPDSNDRPYAGWTYGALGIIQDRGQRLDAFEIVTGIVGPSSHAQKTQEQIHEILGSDNPEGWDSQLEDEVGFRVTYGQSRIFEVFPSSGGTRVQFIPSWAGTIGNIETSINLSGAVRLGQYYGKDYGPPLIRTNIPGTGFYVPQNRFEWYSYLHLGGHYVAQDLFLDGNTIHDGPSVERLPFQGEIQTGFVLTWYDYRISYTHVLPSKEFKNQPEKDDYGAITLSLRF